MGKQKKKKDTRPQVDAPNRDAWVTEPERAPDGEQFAEVAYEHAGHHNQTYEHESGVVFEPGRVVTYRSMADVPTVFKDDPKLKLATVGWGVCRVDSRMHYQPLSLTRFERLEAVARSVPVLKPDAQPEPEPEPEPVEEDGGDL